MKLSTLYNEDLKLYERCTQKSDNCFEIRNKTVSDGFHRLARSLLNQFQKLGIRKYTLFYGTCSVCTTRYGCWFDRLQVTQ